MNLVMRGFLLSAAAGLVMATLLSLGFVSISAHAEEEFVHPGYLDDVRDERFEITREVVIVPPAQPEPNHLVDKIFTERLTQKFRKEYHDRFGYTEFEQIELTSNRFEDIGGSNGRLLPVNQHIELQESYGKYLGRELVQYHVDNYLKSSPQTRAIYKAKEAISNVEVGTKEGYKYKMKYNLASNRLNISAEKPQEIIHKQVDIKMGGGRETVVRLGYDVSKTVKVGSDYSIENQILSLRGERRLTASLATSITGQQYNKDIDASTPKQNRVLLGLSWND